MKFIKSNGIIIRKKDVREADRIITVFTENFGKLDILVKGIRKSKRRDQSATDILSYSNLTYYRKGDNYILNTIELVENFHEIRLEIDKLEITSYLLDVVNKVVYPGERKREFFIKIKKALEFITKNEKYLNYVMLLKMLSWIIKKEGYMLNINGEKYLDIYNSEITNEKRERTLVLEKEMSNIILDLERNINENFLEKKFSLKTIVETIIIYEKYLSCNIDINLNIRKHLLEEVHAKYS